ncbi:major facilitator family transporter [Caballeronia hypogeia]|uniref:Major facilitator family transporter n=1 Tax=Caballeronia hypogeia TaxID=1777140 RepID=A0A158CJD4_9BURK|nr:MFS transporter [Caballeronia hypogeia]SAK82392.1 major facilitator family transporter [Caballeronia hypogeia]
MLESVSNASIVDPSEGHQTDQHLASKIRPSAIVAAVAGNALEVYDFIIYAFFAVYIGRAFFPLQGAYGSMLAATATFGVGFIVRPLGAILIGSFADRVGRKPAMILTVMLITVGTLGIAATPSYESIGIAAPIIVVLCRLFQGFALGGEIGPATTLLVEAAPANRRAAYSSWQLASQGIAVATGGTIGVIVAMVLEPKQLAAWGWRIPFLLSLLLVPIAVYIRRQLPETHAESGERTTGEVVGGVLREHGRVVFLSVLLMMAVGVASQVGNYLVSFAILTLKLPAAVAQSSSIIGGIMTFAPALAAGLWCDVKGRKVVLVLPRLLLAVSIIPCFMWLVASPSTASFLIVTTVIASLTAMTAVATIVTVPELLPAKYRSTGLSMVYALGASLFGGATQFVVTWLLKLTNDPLTPAYVVAVTTGISLIAAWLLPETRDVDVSQ